MTRSQCTNQVHITIQFHFMKLTGQKHLELGVFLELGAMKTNSKSWLSRKCSSSSSPSLLEAEGENDSWLELLASKKSALSGLLGVWAAKQLVSLPRKWHLMSLMTLLAKALPEAVPKFPSRLDVGWWRELSMHEESSLAVWRRV